MPRRRQYTVPTWTGGANVSLANALLKDTEGVTMQNVEIRDPGIIRKRFGCEAYMAYAAAMQGLYRYYDTSGNGITVAIMGGVAKRETSPTWTNLTNSTTNPPTFSATARVRFFAWGEWLYMCDGTNLAAYNGTLIRAIGYPTPSAGPTATLRIGTDLGIGDYKYKLSFNCGNGFSSPFATATEITTTSGNQGVDLDVSAVAVPDWADGYVIWRTEVDADLYRLLTTLPTATTTYADLIPDEDLGQEMESNRNAPPSCKAGAMHAARALYYGEVTLTGSTYPNRLYYSEVGEPDVVYADSYLEVGGPDEGIRAVISDGDTAWILKDNSVWALHSAAEPADVRLSRVADGVGCVGYDAATMTPDGVLMFSRNGLTLMGRGGFKPVGRRQIERHLGDYIDETNYLDTVNVEWYEKRGYVMCGYRTASATGNTLVYDPRSDAWYDWNLNAMVWAAWGGNTDDGEMIFAPWGGGSNKVWKLDTDSLQDGTSAISTHATLKAADFGTPGMSKILTGIDLFMFMSGTTTMQLQVEAIDGSKDIHNFITARAATKRWGPASYPTTWSATLYTWGGDVTTTDRNYDHYRYSAAHGMQSDRFQLDFQETGTSTPWEIHGFRAHYVPLPNRATLRGES